jgi:hypothetical protein
VASAARGIVIRHLLGAAWRAAGDCSGVACAAKRRIFRSAPAVVAIRFGRCRITLHSTAEQATCSAHWRFGHSSSCADTDNTARITSVTRALSPRDHPPGTAARLRAKTDHTSPRTRSGCGAPPAGPALRTTATNRCLFDTRTAAPARLQLAHRYGGHAGAGNSERAHRDRRSEPAAGGHQVQDQAHHQAGQGEGDRQWRNTGKPPSRSSRRRCRASAPPPRAAAGPQVMAAYCAKKAVQSGTLRLLFDNHYVKEDDTPDSVGGPACGSAWISARCCKGWQAARCNGWRHPPDTSRVSAPPPPPAARN